ncbi:MAG: phytanoyl-CoA dioxygenase family protein [Caulobacter sp.]|nr:phytanoyl-CoA dioxygenase family protein [Caulobacter sp.]
MASTKGDKGAGKALPPIPWVESDALEAHLATSQAGFAAKAFARDLARNGFAILDLGEGMATLCDRIVAETAHHFAAPGVQRVHDAWRRSPAIREFATHPVLVEVLELAYGRRTFPFQSLNFMRGSEQSIHCDTLHFHADPALFMCGVWLALEDVTPGSGPLRYYPGSHRLPVLNMQDVQGGAAEPVTTTSYAQAYDPAILAQLEAVGLQPVQALLKKGQVGVWAANLAHGGSPILDPDSTRQSLVVHYYFEDCVYYTPMLSTAAKPLVRLPDNIATGGWTWPRRQGRPVPVPLKYFGAAIAYNLLRLTPRF